MLTLKNIKKDYILGSQVVQALKGSTISFRKNEFVSILGPSGCGKTTTLNIIGGLDRYTSGDLIIDGRSTTSFKDADWDAYRNSQIGFVFQNYNLISHLTILDNVEIALSLSGVSAKERKEKAKKALREVGLADQLNKKPNQLSGGQMQRVAIARALVNDPNILLADEPTGALDTKTSEQIMSLIQEISKDRLVIMVTHNDDIAHQYSNRIIRLLDGEIIEDTNPYQDNTEKQSIGSVIKKTSMNYLEALKTSFKNLLTKKGRTLITAFAGSIGIIGVSLVLGLSSGMNAYIDEIESDSLAGFPITINQSVQTEMFGPGEDVPNPTDLGDFPEEEVMYSYDAQASLITHTNIMNDALIDYIEAMDPTFYTSISYMSAMQLHIISNPSEDIYSKVNIQTTQSTIPGESNLVYQQLPSNPSFVQSQYDILSGSYPVNMNEAVIVVDGSNQVDTRILEALGISINESYRFDEIIGLTYKVVSNDDYYIKNNQVFIPNTNYSELYHKETSVELKIVGIMRIKQDATSSILSEGLWYTDALTRHMETLNINSEIVLAQQANNTINLLNGQPFNASVSYKSVLQILGGDLSPRSIQIYPSSYDAKDDIKAYLDEYNIGKDPIDQVVYTDLAEQVSNTIGSLIDTITIILTALAAVSLIVSSIMIGIITYVSVVERTKEIGIMRSLGARKKDISRIFNAEALLVGLTSGILGIGVYYILQAPLNGILGTLIDVSNIASLPLTIAVGLILLSSVLTLISGLIPSRIAAQKDPVVALRTE